MTTLLLIRLCFIAFVLVPLLEAQQQQPIPGEAPSSVQERQMKQQQQEGQGATNTPQMAQIPVGTNTPQLATVNSSKKAGPRNLNCHELNSRNFATKMRESSKWLILFYAPWCSHCRQFEPAYAELAREYHAESNRGILVGKVDGDAEMALASRFDIRAYPSMYLIDGWDVYTFDGDRSKKKIREFVEGGYKDTEPIPILYSPMGPMGVMQGLLIETGNTFADIFFWIQKMLGLSEFVCSLLIAGFFFFGCLVLILILAVCFTPKTKID